MVDPERSIFDDLAEPDPEAEARREAEADADIAAGRVVPHEEVGKWLLTWGTPDETPMPEAWLK